MRLHAIAYLLLHNAMFIAPRVELLAIAYYGMGGKHGLTSSGATRSEAQTCVSPVFRSSAVTWPP